MTMITSKPVSGEGTPHVRRQTATLWPWLMMFGRITMFASVQAVFALLFFLTGSTSPWETSANWWPFTVFITNVIYLILLVQIFRAEGNRYWDIFRFHREHVKGDLLTLLILTAVMAPVSYLPNILLGQWLFGSPEATLDLFVRPLPLWAAYASIILFSATQGMVEIPTYFGYVMPRFEKQGITKWIAISLPAILLGLQHLASPLLFDIRFITWRGLMFIPFGFLVGIVMHWRPRLLPYIAIIHALMDMSLATMLLSVTY